MRFFDYIVRSVSITNEAVTIELRPKEGHTVFHFLSGQYVGIKNPAFSDPDSVHFFSLASSPNNHKSLELFIKIYGNWTKKIFGIKQGNLLKISEPQGSFTWDEKKDRKAVFLVGGTGISPVISMLRFINEGEYRGDFLLLYGNRTTETVAYKETLQDLERKIHTLTVVYIFSELKENDAWSGHKGFITGEILQSEVKEVKSSTFFVVGPPIFLDKMKNILYTLGVSSSRIKTERAR